MGRRLVLTPECDKLHAVRDRSQEIGAFLDWLIEDKQYVLAKYTPQADYELVPQNVSIERLLAEYFEIDMDKVDAERRAILESLRERQQ